MVPGKIFVTSQVPDYIAWFTVIHHAGFLSICDLRKVQRATWDARLKWQNIGVELDIDPGTLDSIKGNNDNNEDRFRAMLTTWLKKAQPKPTLTALAEALQSPTVDYGHLAERILSLK